MIISTSAFPLHLFSLILVPIYIQLDVRSSQNGASHSPSEGKLNQTMAIMPMPSSGPVPSPTTNLNIGMDYWANTASSTPAIHGKVTPTTVTGAVVPGEQWIQVCVLPFTPLFMHYILSFPSFIFKLGQTPFPLHNRNIPLLQKNLFLLCCIIPVDIFMSHVTSSMA